MSSETQRKGELRMKNKIILGLTIIMLLAIGAWTAYGQKTKSSVISYEYAVLYDPTESMSMDDGINKLNELGAHGWEIVGIDRGKMYLKRTRR